MTTRCGIFLSQIAAPWIQCTLPAGHDGSCNFDPFGTPTSDWEAIVEAAGRRPASASPPTLETHKADDRFSCKKCRRGLAMQMNQTTMLYDEWGCCNITCSEYRKPVAVALSAEAQRETAATPTETQIAWLIEDTQGYWRGDIFTPDHSTAVRFARQEDAERVIVFQPFKLAVAVEHMWINAVAAAPDTGDTPK